MINPSKRNLVVIDDLIQKLGNDPRITSLFTKGCHHRNLSVIFILQNIFHRGKELRDVSLNCHYLVLFKSPRDSSQIIHLAKQMFPGHVKYTFSITRIRDCSREKKLQMHRKRSCAAGIDFFHKAAGANFQRRS